MNCIFAFGSDHLESKNVRLEHRQQPAWNRLVLESMLMGQIWFLTTRQNLVNGLFDWANNIASLHCNIS